MPNSRFRVGDRTVLRRDGSYIGGTVIANGLAFYTVKLDNGYVINTFGETMYKPTSAALRALRKFKSGR